jgi:hypothetical protein
MLGIELSNYNVEQDEKTFLSLDMWNLVAFAF